MQHYNAQNTPSLLLHSPYLQVCYAENRGRYLIAKEDIPKDTLIFSTTAYATNILESFKKRLCFTCLKYNEKGRFELHCRECAQVYFCSPECKDKFSATHEEECECLRKLWSSRFGVHIVSVLHLAVFILKRRACEILGIDNTTNAYSTPTNIANSDTTVNTNSANVDSDNTTNYPSPNNKNSNQLPLANITTSDNNINTPDITALSINSASEPTGIHQALPTTERQPTSETTTQELLQDSTEPEPKEPAEPIKTIEPTKLTEPKEQANPTESTEPTEPVDVNSNWELSHLPTFQDVALLTEHHESIPDYDINYYRRGITLLKSTLRGSLYECNKDLLNDDALLRLVSKIESNGFGVWKDQICMGRALYPFASFFNHSCEPNCVTRQAKGFLYIYTMGQVSKGEELCISYIDSNLPRCNRQLALQRDYYFTCCCTRCEKEKLEPPKAQKYSYSKSVNNSLKGKKGEEKQRKKKNEKKMKNIKKVSSEGEGSATQISTEITPGECISK